MDDLYFQIDAALNGASGDGGGGTGGNQGTGIRGAVYDLSDAEIVCRNLNTGKAVKGNISNAPTWNCTDLGLKGKAGQRVKITITGKMQ